MKELKELSDRLASLLADPHPGLCSWTDALHNAIADIAKYGSVHALTVALEYATKQMESRR